MSSLEPRRADKRMDDKSMEALLLRAATVALATRDREGVPYVVPNLFVYEPGLLRVHTTSADSHFRRNIEADPRLCFTVHETGEVYPYGAFACHTSISYASVVGWGTASIERDAAAKARFFDAFMAKYADPAWNRPAGVYPRLGEVTVYRIPIERMTGKAGALPAMADRWRA